MNDINELTEYLQARADAVDLGHTPVGVITRAGLRRRHRHRAVATAGVLATGALATVATIQVVSRGDQGRKVSTDSDAPVPTEPTTTESTSAPETTTGSTPATTDTAASVVDSPLVWNDVTVGSAESIALLDANANWTTTMTSPDGVLYQSATTPGRQRLGLTAMLYRSDDGVSWTPAPDQMFEGRVPPLAVDGDRLYAISTTAAGAAGTAGDGTLYAATSLNGGEDWQTAPLPYDLAAIRNTPGVQEVVVGQRQAAANGHGVVIAAQVSAWITPASAAARLGVDPASLQHDSGRGFIQREVSPIDCADLEQRQIAASEEYEGDGEDVQPGVDTGDGHCVLWGAEVRRFSWADLGFSGDVEQARQGALALFHSADGSTFTRIESPVTGAVQGVNLTASRGQFLITVGSPAVDDNASSTTTAFVSDDGIEWRRLPDLPASTDCGVAGAAYLGDTPVLTAASCSGPPQFLIERDGAWLTSTIPQPADGATPDSWRLTQVGTAGIAVVTQVGAQQRLTADGVCCETPDVSASRWVLSFSRDGVSWSQIELNDLVGDTSTQLVTAVRVTDSNVIVSMRPRLDLIGADDPLPDVTVLIGTLA